MLRKFTLGAVLSFSMVSLAFADMDIVIDDFESYQNDGEMQTAWVPSTSPVPTGSFIFDANTPGQPYVLPPSPGGLEGQAVLFDGTNGGVNISSTAFQIAPSATQNVELQVDLAHDILTSNKRLSMGLRGISGATTENIIELGFYNALPLNQNGVLSQFGFRTVLMPGSTNWQPFNLPANLDQIAASEISTASFHTFKAVISETDVTLTLDIFADGTVDATNVVPAVTTALGYNQLRFGGPSGVTSADPLLAVDNVSLRLVDIPVSDDDADFDEDGDVDGKDFIAWQRGFGIDDGTALRENGDATGEGNVDQDDLVVWQAQYGNPLTANVAAVPEPASAALLLLAMAGLVGSSRRRAS